jgi:Ca2+-binding EF-hand superfamily protein
LQTEEANKEILNAFKLYDTKKTGYISAKELKMILTMTGEKLSSKDGKL